MLALDFATCTLLLWQGGVVVDVVDHRGISSDLGVYRREEGEETLNR